MTDYARINAITNSHMEGPNCDYAGAGGMWPADTVEYDVEAMKSWWDIFTEMVTTEPGLAGSATMIEGYSTQAVEAVPEASTAFALRGEKLLL